MPHDLEILCDTIDMWSFQFRCLSTITPKNFALVTLCIASFECWMLLKELWPWNLGVTIDFKTAIEKHLRLVSREASQRLSILRKFWRASHNRFLIWRCIRGSVRFVLEYCASLWCSAAERQPKLMDHGVSDARYLSGRVFECDIAQSGSVALLCVLYKI